MTTLALAPSLPIPGREFSAVFTLEQSGANFVRVWCVVAPSGSELSTEIAKAATSNARTLVYEGAGGSSHPWTVTLDKGGSYSLVAQEYQRGTGFSGGYQGDTRANMAETKLSTEYALSLVLGQRCSPTIGTGQDTAQLVFWVWSDTIQATTLAIHGEATPAVVKPNSPKATTAAAFASVTTAAAALSGIAVATALGNVSAIVANMRTKFNAHIVLTSGSVHANADSDNTLAAEYGSAPTPQSLKSFDQQLLRLLRQHETNDKGSGIGSAASPYHSPGSVTAADMGHLPLVAGISGDADAYMALADLWRAYESHRVSLLVHGAADSTNTLTALPLLLAVNAAFLTVLATVAPAAAVGDTSAAAQLRSLGFTVV